MARTSFARLSLLTVAVLLLGACTSSSTPGGSSSAAAGDRCAGVGTSGAEGELQIPDVEEGKFNVAMVLIGPHDDAGWSQAHYEGLRYLCENIEDSHVAYVENVLEGAASEQVFRSLARKGFDFIIGTSFGYMDPMARGGRGVPGRHLPAPDRLQVEWQELRQLLRRDGGLQVPRRHAGRVARQGRREPQDRLHGHVPDPRRAPTWQRDHARRQEDLPRVHDGRPLHQHVARPDQGEGRGRVAVRRRSTGRVHRRRHAVPSPTSPRRRASGASPTTTPHRARSNAASPLPTGSGDPSTPALARRSRRERTRPATSTSTPIRRRWACSASWTARRSARASPTCRRPTSRRCVTRWPRCSPVSGPVRHVRRTDHRQHRQGGPGRRREARAVRPRPVPARRTRQRVRDVHVLVGRRDHRRAAGPPVTGCGSAGLPPADPTPPFRDRDRSRRAGRG